MSEGGKLLAVIVIAAREPPFALAGGLARQRDTWNRAAMGALIRLNRDLFIRTLLLTVAILLLTRAGAFQGPLVLAANGPWKAPARVSSRIARVSNMVRMKRSRLSRISAPIAARLQLSRRPATPPAKAAGGSRAAMTITASSLPPSESRVAAATPATPQPRPSTNATSSMMWMMLAATSTASTARIRRRPISQPTMTALTSHKAPPQ